MIYLFITLAVMELILVALGGVVFVGGVRGELPRYSIFTGTAMMLIGLAGTIVALVGVVLVAINWR